MSGGNQVTPSLWRRWDSPGVNLFSYCPFGYANGEDEEHPCNDESAEEQQRVEYFSAWRRVLIRHTPVLVFAFIVWEIGPWIWKNNRLLVAVPLLIAFLLFLAATFLDLDGFFLDVLRSIGGGIVLGYLLLGTVLFVVESLFIAGDVTTAPVEASGYYLLLYLGGILVYDGMLRTENLFCKLGSETRLIYPSDGYSAERDRLAQQLKFYHGWEGRRPKTSLTSFHVFVGIVLALLIAYVTGRGVVEIWQSLALPTFQIVKMTVDFLIVLATRLFIVFVAFKFVVLVTFLNRLSGIGNDYSVRLLYHPYHPDEMGGFRDIGKFATRVNVLILIGGAYLLYFSLVTEPFPMAIVWIVYLVVVGLWFWYSIIPLHRRMIRDRELWYQAGDKPDSDWETVGGFADDPNWEELRNAPEWPLPTGQLTRLAGANLAPFFIWLIKIWIQSNLG